MTKSDQMTTEEMMQKLRNLSRSPHELEPPRRRRAVNFFVALAERLRKGGQWTPHLGQGSDLQKVEYEYNIASHFFEVIRDYVDISVLDGKDVLDAGCGWGGKMVYHSQHSNCNTLHGFDLPEVFVPEVAEEFARQQNVNNCHFTVGYAEGMPYDDHSFDVVITEDVLEHVRDPEKVIQECYRVLRPGGLVIFKFPSFKMMYAHHLDRAIYLPGLHYVLPMKVWASGLNQLIIDYPEKYAFDPFTKVIKTKFNKGVMSALNGVDLKGFEGIIQRTQFDTQTMTLIPYDTSVGKRKLSKSVYNVLWKFKPFKEFLAYFILYIGQK